MYSYFIVIDQTIRYNELSISKTHFVDPYTKGDDRIGVHDGYCCHIISGYLCVCIS